MIYTRTMEAGAWQTRLGSPSFNKGIYQANNTSNSQTNITYRRSGSEKGWMDPYKDCFFIKKIL